MEMERFQRAQRRIATDVEEQSNIDRKTVCRGHNCVKQVTEKTDTSDDEMTDAEDPLLKIEEVSSVKMHARQAI